MPTWPPLTLGQSLDLEEISSQELDSPVFSLSLKGSSGLILVQALERQGLARSEKSLQLCVGSR